MHRLPLPLPQDPPVDGNTHFTQSSTPTNINLVTAAAANGAALPPSKLLVAHGVLMAVAYAFGMPAAAFAARWDCRLPAVAGPQAWDARACFSGVTGAPSNSPVCAESYSTHDTGT